MCSDRNMEVKLSSLLGNYDIQTDRPTSRGRKIERDIEYISRMSNNCTYVVQGGLDKRSKICGEKREREKKKCSEERLMLGELAIK